MLLRTGEDLFHLRELEQTLWVASSCPTRGLNLENETLDMIDRDGDGRIRPPDLFAALDWLESILQDREALVGDTDTLPLKALRRDTPEGQALWQSGQAILQSLGLPEETPLTLNLLQTVAGKTPEIAAPDPAWERLLRLQRDFYKLINNFVAMPDFYHRDRFAIFQMGCLIMDGCALWMCVKVQNIEAHAELAAASGIFLIYCEARRRDVADPLHLCAAITARRARRFMVGKNGLYYDRHGRDWDARIVRVIVNPVSLREAIWAPFRRIGEAMGRTLEKLTTTRQNAVEGQLSESLIQSQTSAPPPPGAPPPQSPQQLGWMLAGGGVAIAALSSSVAYLARTIYATETYHLVTAILLIGFFIVGPSTLLGYLRLRARDLGMILEASGWAINAPMRINWAIARHLSREGQVPLHAKRIPWVLVSQTPAYRKKRVLLLSGVLILTVLGWVLLR